MIKILFLILKLIGISLMGTAAPYFSVLFFVMMLLLGFGSEFSIMEAILSTIKGIFYSYNH